MATELGLSLCIPSFDGFNVTGVYFLYRSGEVVYVGQAVDIRRRICSHIAEGVKTFDAVSFIRCERDKLDATERRYIQALRPEYNKCAIARRPVGRLQPQLNRVRAPIVSHDLTRAEECRRRVDLMATARKQRAADKTS